MTARTAQASERRDADRVEAPPCHYLAHGWRVTSKRTLHSLPIADQRAGDHELSIAWDVCMAAPSSVTDELVRCETPDGVWYTAGIVKGGYELSFNGCCTFRVSEDLSSATCVPEIGTNSALTTVLASGALLAFVMAMRGQCVLHAGAVEVDGRAVAIVGSTGSGKSTVTAALCTVGCPLVTDDVLRVELDESGDALAHRGTSEVRLRPGARMLARRFDDPIRARETEDGRLAIRPAATHSRVLPLGALIVPRPRPHTTAVAVRRTPPMVAMRHLLSYPRLVGWRDQDVLRQQLSDLAQLVQRVPMYVADLPLGPPFPHTTSERLYARLSEVVTARSTP